MWKWSYAKRLVRTRRSRIDAAKEASVCAWNSSRARISLTITVIKHKWGPLSFFGLTLLSFASISFPSSTLSFALPQIRSLWWFFSLSLCSVPSFHDLFFPLSFIHLHHSKLRFSRLLCSASYYIFYQTLSLPHYIYFSFSLIVVVHSCFFLQFLPSLPFEASFSFLSVPAFVPPHGPLSFSLFIQPLSPLWPRSSFSSPRFFSLSDLV